MKKLVVSTLLAGAVALPLLASTAPAAPKKGTAAKGTAKAGTSKAGAKWHPTMESALAEAKRTGKPIFVDIFTTWCGPCKYLDAVTYKDAKFIAESKNWVLVKVDAEKGPKNVALASKFKVQGYPTMLFLKPNGQEAGRAVGGYPASMLVPAMKKAAEKAGGGKSI